MSPELQILINFLISVLVGFALVSAGAAWWIHRSRTHGGRSWRNNSTFVS